MEPHFRLVTGAELPAVGFGTFRIKGTEKIHFVIDEALNAGYRLFDTARVYGNEGDIGRALKILLPKYGLTRKDIFVTSKLSPADHGGGEKTENALKKSLSDLGTEYLDLYLIHWPGVTGIPVDDKSNSILRRQTWKTLTEVCKKGLARAIGVSNYNVRHLKELLSDNGAVPAVNQVEWHPYYYQPELLNLCNEHGIILQAYCSLGGSLNKELLTNSVVNAIAKKLDVSNAQLLLKWALQQNVAIIPKATSKEHISKNIQLKFEIPDEEILTLNKLVEVGRKFAWNPDTVC